MDENNVEEVIDKFSDMLDKDFYNSLDEIENKDKEIVKKIEENNKNISIFCKLMYKTFFEKNYLDTYKDINNLIYKRIYLTNFCERGDFSLENALIDPNIRVKIIDFKNYFNSLLNFRFNNFKNLPIYKFDNKIHQEFVNSWIILENDELRKKLNNKILF